jgi:superfamily I DNA and/or RNA helicase
LCIFLNLIFGKCIADIVIGNLTVSFEEKLYKQLDDALSPSAPEYKKHHDNVHSVAKLYAQDIRLRYLYDFLQEGKEVTLSKSIDEQFDMLGQEWLYLSQFVEALKAFMTSVEISEMKGSWCLQRLCARCNHVAHVFMNLGCQQEQLKASMRSVAFAFAAAWKDPSLIDNSTNHLLLVFSLYNLAIQFLNYNDDISIFNNFKKDLPQVIIIFSISFLKILLFNCIKTWSFVSLHKVQEKHALV